MNSSIARLIVTSYTIETGISTHVLKHVYVPKYDSSDRLHIKLVELSKEAHVLARELYEKGDKTATLGLKRIEDQVDNLAAKLYGITDEELDDIRQTLRILKEGKSEEPDDEEEADA